MSGGSDTARAVVWHGGRDLRVETLPLPPAGPEDVVIDVAACGLCGTDMHVVRDEMPSYVPPRVLGHEPSGTVRAVGAAVAGVAPGDRVTWEPSSTCRACWFCREGLEAFCEHRSMFSGAMAESVVVPRRAVHRLPDGVDLRHAVLAEPTAVALNAVERASIRAGDRVVVIGGGSIGLLVALVSRRAGAGHVVLSEPLAREMTVRFRRDDDVCGYVLAPPERRS